MITDIDREILLRIRSQTQEDEAVYQRNVNNPTIERSGSGSSMLAGQRRLQAILAYVLDHDVSTFQRFLYESVVLELSLLRRCDQGEPIDDSYVTLLQHREMLFAMSLGLFEISSEFARRLVPREEASRHHIRPIDLAFGMCTCMFVLRDKAGMSRWSIEFGDQCRRRGGKTLAGYLEVFQALLCSDLDATNRGLQLIAKLHRRECGPEGIFTHVHKDICLWGAGMANLARWHGVAASSQPPLIPEELLIPGLEKGDRSIYG